MLVWRSQEVGCCATVLALVAYCAAYVSRPTSFNFMVFGLLEKHHVTTIEINRCDLVGLCIKSSFVL